LAARAHCWLMVNLSSTKGWGEGTMLCLGHRILSVYYSGNLSRDHTIPIPLSAELFLSHLCWHYPVL